MGLLDDSYEHLFRWPGHILSFITLLLCLFIVILIIQEKEYSNITDKLLLSILVSETLNGLSNCSAFPLLLMTNAEHDIKMRYCYPTILLNLFTNLYTTSSSTFLGINIYYFFINPDFNQHKYTKLFTYIPLYSSLIISYCLWIIQLILFQKDGKNYARILSCWISMELNIVIYVIIWIFIFISTVYFILTYRYINKKTNKSYSDRLSEEMSVNESDAIEYEGENTHKSHKKIIKKTQSALLLFPCITAIIWIIYTCLNFNSSHTYSDGSTDYKKPGLKVNSWLTCLLTSTRGIVYCILFLSKNKIICGKFFEILKIIFCCKKKSIYSTPTALNVDIDSEPETTF